jgi:anti-sigma regulatory factor (Ser/Thr protein kinase)
MNPAEGIDRFPNIETNQEIEERHEFKGRHDETHERFVPHLQEFLKKLTWFNFNKSTLEDIEIGFAEALIDAIKYGNNDNPDLPVFVTFSADSKKITITILDQNPIEFNPDEASNSVKNEKEKLLGSGRGITMMRAYYNEVHFEFKNPGNEVQLIKYINQQQ